MRMALRALLFSSDGTSTSALCQVLTDLGIEAEICPEMLVAVQRITQESYDALLVDWDQEEDAISLLKSVREHKPSSQALNLALVKNDKDLPRALRHGANSVIRKPVDQGQARDTLSTARDLILSRRSEQKTKEERAAAAHAAMAAAAAELQEEVEAPPTKTGFVAQTAPRSAFEAAELTETQDPRTEPSPRQTEPAPMKVRELEAEPDETQSIQKKRWDEKPQPQQVPSVEVAVGEVPQSEDSTGVFSSLPEEEDAQADVERESHPRYLVFALLGCLVIAGVLWVWAPGTSYLGRLSSVIRSIPRTSQPPASKPAAAAPTAHLILPQEPSPPPPPAPIAPEDGLAPVDPGPTDSAEGDPGDLQVIETKAIPKPGAQQSPATEPPVDLAQPQSEPAKTTEERVPVVQPPAPVRPAIVPIVRSQNPVAVPVHENAVSASAGRTGVIIPESLRGSPSQSPASSLDSGLVPEETSRNLVEHRVEPEYPAQALPHRLEGFVVLQVWVTKEGAVQDVKLMRGNFALGRSAVDAVRQWRFKPYSPNGKPIDFQTIVTLGFKYPG
jgi:TonB family protein